MSIFRKIPIVVEARQYTRNKLAAAAIAEWCGWTQTDDGCELDRGAVVFYAKYDDWIVKDTRGKFKAYAPDDFAAIYEKICL